jgi:hypothetical protein
MFRYYYLQNLPEVFENYFVANNQTHRYNLGYVIGTVSFKETNYVKYTLYNKRN